MKTTFIILLIWGLCMSVNAQKPDMKFHELAQPDTSKLWIQPVQGEPAMAVWGHAKGISVAIPQLDMMPRGLIYIFTPYLGHDKFNVTNFIAMEPIPVGQEYRGFSELEMSTFDAGIWGKRFWSSDNADYNNKDNGIRPARGVISKENGKETLTVYIFSEPFDNGAKVYVRLRFFEDRPYEFELTSYTYDGSADLDNFILSATMGNKARLRTLYLNDYQKTSFELWPDYKADDFALHAHFSAKDMIHDKKGYTYFIAAPNEEDPSKATYSDGTIDHWKYKGKIATQYWISKNPSTELEGLVNARYVYWASKAPIPGGISFENFEMKEPFKNGNQYIFGITPDSPAKFVEKAKKGRYK